MVSMQAPKVDFFKWGVFNERGIIIGVREDAPDEVKKEYKQFHESYEAVLNGINGRC